MSVRDLTPNQLKLSLFIIVSIDHCAFDIDSVYDIMGVSSGTSNLTARCFPTLIRIRIDESTAILVSHIGQMSIRPRSVVAFVKAV